jgi:hypothetical protein
MMLSAVFLHHARLLVGLSIVLHFSCSSATDLSKGDSRVESVTIRSESLVERQERMAAYFDRAELIALVDPATYSISERYRLAGVKWTKVFAGLSAIAAADSEYVHLLSAGAQVSFRLPQTNAKFGYAAAAVGGYLVQSNSVIKVLKNLGPAQWQYDDLDTSELGVLQTVAPSLAAMNGAASEMLVVHPTSGAFALFTSEAKQTAIGSTPTTVCPAGPAILSGDDSWQLIAVNDADDSVALLSTKGVLISGKWPASCDLSAVQTRTADLVNLPTALSWGSSSQIFVHSTNRLDVFNDSEAEATAYTVDCGEALGIAEISAGILLICRSLGDRARAVVIDPASGETVREVEIANPARISLHTESQTIYEALPSAFGRIRKVNLTDGSEQQSRDLLINGILDR